MKTKERYNPLYWIVQLTSWGMFSILLAMAQYITDNYDSTTNIQIFFLYILLILSTHTIRYVLLKKDWINLKIWELTPRALGLIFVISFGLSFLTAGFRYLITGGDVGRKWESNAELFINIIMHAIFFILWTAVYLTYHLFQKSRIQELNTLRLQTSQSESELKALRDQLNPHFLFNSLNNIRALIEIDPKLAKSTITTLSSLLRSSLVLGKKVYVTLEEELNLVEQYLKLEKVRFEERLNYEIRNDINNTIYILPFLIQSMVENAVKHGISQSTSPGKINIHTYFEADNLVLEVHNTGEYNPNPDTGIGTTNTTRRLEIMYRTEANFKIKNEDNLVKARITINKNCLNIEQYESNNN